MKEKIPEGLKNLVKNLQKEIKDAYTSTSWDGRFDYVFGVEYALKQINSIFGTEYEDDHVNIIIGKKQQRNILSDKACEILVGSFVEQTRKKYRGNKDE